MSKYEVQYDSEFKTYMVLEHIAGTEFGSRVWEIIGEYSTEHDAVFAMRDLQRAEDIEIHAEFG